MRGGRLPSSASSICSAAILPIFIRASLVTPAVLPAVQHIVELQQRMFRRRWLFVPDVEPGARILGNRPTRFAA